MTGHFENLLRSGRCDKKNVDLVAFEIQIFKNPPKNITKKMCVEYLGVSKKCRISKFLKCDPAESGPSHQILMTNQVLKVED